MAEPVSSAEDSEAPRPDPGASADGAFERLTRLVVRAVGAPAAVVALRRGAGLRFVSAADVPGAWLAPEGRAAAEAIAARIADSGAPLAAADARSHPLLATLAGSGGAFLGVPLRTAGGEVLGTLCVMDDRTRRWTEDEVEMLADLSAAAVAEVELLAARREAEDRASEASELAVLLQLQAMELKQRVEESRTLNEKLRSANEKLELVNRELVELSVAADTARDQAERANRAKADFLAAMSHDLRTPLNAIAGYVQLIEMGLKGPVTEEQAEALGRIHRNQEHLLALINDVLHFAKIESGKLEVRTADVPLAELLAGLEPLIAPQVRERELHYGCEACDPLLRVRGERERIEQILVNLLTNAIKFTEPGGRVTVEVGAEEEWVRVRVRDTGCGIAPGKLKSIFDPFVQVGSDRDTRRGVGLGLAISRELAQVMGGDLSAMSQVGEGSVFTLSLLRGKRVAVQDIFAQEPAHEPAEERARATAGDEA